MSYLTDIITASEPALRNQSLDVFARKATLHELLEECAALDAFRRRSDNLYERVRALLFLHAIHRFHLPGKAGVSQRGLVPFDGYEHLLNRRFEEAISIFLEAQDDAGPNDAICSALAAAYHAPGLSDAGRPGAPQRALRARQPVDVPHRPSRRSAAAHSPGTA